MKHCYPISPHFKIDHDNQPTGSDYQLNVNDTSPDTVQGSGGRLLPSVQGSGGRLLPSLPEGFRTLPEGFRTLPEGFLR